MRICVILLLSFIFTETSLQVSNERFNTLLSSYVDSAGNVNYKGIIDNPFALNDYLKFIKEISPKSHPSYFDLAQYFWLDPALPGSFLKSRNHLSTP